MPRIRKRAKQSFMILKINKALLIPPHEYTETLNTYSREFDRTLAPHPHRLLNYYRSRKALQEALELSSFPYLPDLNANYKISLSHSASMAVALLMSHDTVTGIGIDIEEKSRKISLTVQKKIMTHTNLDPLSTWVVKEACFKTFQSEKKKPYAPWEIKLPSKDFFIWENIKGSYQLSDWEDHLLAIATLSS